MNEETRKLYLKKYTEEKAALQALKKQFDATTTHLTSEASINMFERQEETLTRYLSDDGMMLSSIIDTMTNNKYKKEVECGHDIIYPYFGNGNYKCLDCDAKFHEIRKGKLKGKKILSHEMLGRRKEYLEYLINMSSKDAIKQMTLKK